MGLDRAPGGLKSKVAEERPRGVTSGVVMVGVRTVDAKAVEVQVTWRGPRHAALVDQALELLLQRGDQGAASFVGEAVQLQRVDVEVHARAGLW
jgi:hypothetical protein